MRKAIVMRAARPWGSTLVARLLETGAEVIAHSNSKRKLETLKEKLGFPSQLRTVSGSVENLEELLTAARGAEIIFCDAYLTYEDEPEKVQHYLEALSRISLETGAKRVIVEGIYRPGKKREAEIGIDSNMLRILSPELYSSEATNTFVYYAFQKMTRGKPIKQLFAPSVRLEYAFLEDASRDALELALSSSAYGRSWKLRTNGPISQMELLTAGLPKGSELPRFERVARWKLGLLRLTEPMFGQLMDKFHNENPGAGSTATKYFGGELTSYEIGSAITIEQMKIKHERSGKRAGS